ncbi:MAG: hypothetical protein Q7R41_11995, partial [Phycisphaerales bacterium]|nr:hypothetical protein [Phycisphaerales bacterium]
MMLVSTAGVSWSAGCSPSAPPGDDGNGDVPSGDPVTNENVAEFVGALDRTVATAIEGVLADPTLFEAKQRESGVAKIGPNRAEVGGVRGRVLADGLRFGTFWPPRFELSLTFEDYEGADGLALNGTVEYNFVRDDRAVPPLEFGLQSGILTISGRFGGEVNVQSAIVGAERSTSVITAAGAVLQVGTLQRPGFLTYVSTIAGTGEVGLRDGAADQAMFNYPTGIALDDDGRIYVADNRNGAIREIDLDGTVSTVTTNVQEPYDLGFDSKGKLVVSDRLGGGHGVDESPLIRLVVRGDDRGTITPMMLGGEDPFSSFPLCTQRFQYSCDGRSPLNAMPWATGIDVRNQSVLVAQWALGAGLKLVLPDGYLMTILDLGQLTTFTCDETYPGSPSDLVQGNNGEIYYTTGCHAVRVFETDGTVRTLAGRLQKTLEFADGVGDDARFAYPEGLVFDGERYLFVADASNGLIRRVDVETGAVVRVAGCVAHTEGLECDPDLAVRDGVGDHARFHGPQNIAFDKWGDLYVAEAPANVIRLVRILADPDRTPSVHRFDPAV